MFCLTKVSPNKKHTIQRPLCQAFFSFVLSYTGRRFADRRARISSLDSGYRELRVLTFLGTIHEGLQLRGCAI